MDSAELKNRTKQFAINVIRLVDTFPYSKPFEILGRQLVRSASSVGANYRSACRARSRADFISKISIVEEEADECQYWLELFLELESGKSHKIEPLLKEAGELTAIFTAAERTTKQKS
jgi:four helix bundle protein